MRVLCISRAWGTSAGGMERLSYELTTRLQKEADTTVDLVVYRGPRLLSPLFNVLCVPAVMRYAPKADVVHIGDPLLSFVAFIISVFYKKPVAMSVHGLDITYSNPLYQWYLSVFLKYVDIYLPISRHVQELLQGKGYGEKSRIITPGIEDVYYNPAHTRNELTSIVKTDTSSSAVLLTVGRLVKRKGHEWFIRNVLPSLPKKTLYVIAGSGPEEAAIANAIQETKLTSQVYMLGRVSDADMNVLYNTVDAFVQPNIAIPHDAEGFGIVLLEAASAARSVFTSALEGILDAIQPGKNGTLLPSGDAAAYSKALHSFISNEPKPDIAARQYTIQTFGWNAIIASFKEALSSVITAAGK